MVLRKAKTLKKKKLTLAQLARQTEKARQDFKDGKFYTHEEVMEMLGLAKEDSI